MARKSKHIPEGADPSRALLNEVNEQITGMVELRNSFDKHDGCTDLSKHATDVVVKLEELRLVIAVKLVE